MNMKDELKDYGFVAPKIDSDPKAWVLGSTTGVDLSNYPVLRPDSDWSDFLPEYEPQAENYETWSCTVFGTLNNLETLSLLEKKEANYSDRFVSSIAKIRQPGANPHDIAEIIRGYGLVNEEDWPMPKTYKEFIQPVPCRLLKVAKDWLKNVEMHHQWVIYFENLTIKQRKDRIRECLKYGPLGVSVTAWIKDGGVYVDGGQRNTHWCMLYGIANNGYKVFDSYDHSHKVISFDHNISFAKIYFKKKRVPNFLWDLLTSIKGLLLSLGGVECTNDEPKTGFYRDLEYGTVGEDVKRLQELLNEDIRTMVAKAGPGSPGKETNYFGWLTRDALARFQKIHNINPPFGYFGPITRRFINREKMSLIDAIIQVESGGNDYAIGDLDLVNKAFGALQIRQPYMTDALPGREAEECLGNRELSIQAFNAYMNRYATKERLGREVKDEDIARIHNGGPNGYKSPATVGYWDKVKRLIA